MHFPELMEIECEVIWRSKPLPLTVCYMFMGLLHLSSASWWQPSSGKMVKAMGWLSQHCWHGLNHTRDGSQSFSQPLTLRCSDWLRQPDTPWYSRSTLGLWGISSLHPNFPLSVLLGFSFSPLFAFCFFDVAAWEPFSPRPPLEDLFCLVAVNDVSPGKPQ